MGCLAMQVTWNSLVCLSKRICNCTRCETTMKQHQKKHHHTLVAFLPMQCVKNHIKFTFSPVDMIQQPLHRNYFTWACTLNPFKFLFVLMDTEQHLQIHFWTDGIIRNSIGMKQWNFSRKWLLNYRDVLLVIYRLLN